MNEREDVLDVPAFAVLVFGHEVGDFDSCARVEVFAEDAADSTADATACHGGGRRVPPPCDGFLFGFRRTMRAKRRNFVRIGYACGSGGEAWVSRLGEDFDVPNQHVHVCQDADTVVDGVECFRLGCWGGGEYDGGGEREER